MSTSVPDQLTKQKCQSIKSEYDLTHREYDCKEDQMSQNVLSNYSCNETTVLSHVKIEFDEIDKCYYESHIDVDETRWWNDRNPDDNTVKVRSFVCNACKISFATKSEIINHLSESHKCDLNVEHGKQKNAIENSHSVNKACEVTKTKIEIGETTSYGFDIKKEEIQWQETNRVEDKVARTYVCNACHRYFNSKSLVVLHLKNTHNDQQEKEDRRQRPYKCAKCDRSFQQMCSLRCHERIHTGERPYECGICFEAYYWTDLIRIHKWTHTGQCPFKCSVCRRTFRDRKNLEIHQRVVHMKEILFLCLVCDKRFTKKSNLVRHQTLHLADMGDIAKPHECDVCQKSFMAEADLKRHERVHAGETSYKCPKCSMSFSRTDRLKHHQLQKMCNEKTDSK